MTANSSSTSTETSVFASVAQFVDVGSTVIEGKGGPQQTTLSFSNGSSTNVMSYDAQGRPLGYTMTTTMQGSSFTSARGTFNQWDSLGRPTSGTLDYGTPLPTERCTGIVVTMTRNDGARTSNVTLSGGTNSSQFGISNCVLVNTDNTYDANFILVNASHHNPAPHPPLVVDATTVQATATVCY